MTSSSARAALLDEALQHLSDLKTALDDIAREYDNKYSLTNACGRARHSFALLRQRLIEIKEADTNGN